MPGRLKDTGDITAEISGIVEHWRAALGWLLAGGGVWLAALLLLGWAGALGLSRLWGDGRSLWPYLLGVGAGLLASGGCWLAWQLALLSSDNRQGLLRGTVTGAGAPSLGILVLMVAAGPFADTEYTPSLPGLADDLGIDYGTAELTMTTYLLGYGASQLVYGASSDRWGRKPVALVSCTIFLAGSIICWLSPGIGLLLAGRFVQGVGAAGTAVLAIASIRDAYPDRAIGRIYARVNATMAAAPALGPIVGSVVAERYGWSGNMLVLELLAAGLLVMVLLFFPETYGDGKNGHRLKDVLGDYRALFRDPFFGAYALTGGLTSGVVYTALAEAPDLVVNQFGRSTLWFMAVGAAILLAFIIGSLASGWLSTRRPPAQTILYGLLAILAGTLGLGGLLLVWEADLFNTLPPMILVFVGVSLVVANVKTCAMQPFGQVTGAASAMYGFIQMTLASLATAGVSRVPLEPLYSMPLAFGVLGGLALASHGWYVLRRGQLPRRGN